MLKVKRKSGDVDEYFLLAENCVLDGKKGISST